MQPREAVVPTAPDIAPDGRFRCGICPFGCMVNNAYSRWNTRAYTGSCTIDSVIVENFNPVIIADAQLLSIFFAHPAWLNTS